VDGLSNLIQLYLKFEAASPSKCVSYTCFSSCIANLIHILQTTRLPAKGRPPEVDEWIKDQTNIHMSIIDMATYSKAWTSWWSHCQPPGHVAASWPFSRKPLLRDQWGKLVNGGKYGLFLFVMALSWWAKSLGPAASSPDLTGAVADVEWVLDQLTGMLTTLLTSTPAPGVVKEVQAVGRPKCKVKPTEKALNMCENAQKRNRW